MIKKIIAQIEEAKINFGQGLITFFSIVFVRNFLENFSGPRSDQRLIDFFTNFIHYPLAYLALFLSIVLVLHLITRVEIVKVLKFGLIGLAVIWLAPILDLIVTWGRGWTIAYQFTGWQNFFFNLFTLGGEFRNPGATLGVRIEVILIIVGLALYTYLKTASLKKAFLALVSVYLIIFFYFNLPLLLVTAEKLLSGGLGSLSQLSLVSFYNQEIISSGTFLNRTLGLDTTLTLFPWTANRGFETIFNLEISASYIIIIIALALALLKFYQPKRFSAIIKNIRVLRLGHYLFMTGLGIYLGYLFRGRWLFHSAYDYSILLVLFISAAFFWVTAVFYNDLIDEKIDQISNPRRPLPQRIVTPTEMQTLVLAPLVIALVSALIVGYYALVFGLTALALSYLYSAEPLRLKRWPIVNTFLIALASLSLVLSGFFLAGGTEKLNDFPVKVAIVVLGSLTLAFSTKDLKDRVGDEKAGMLTLPVLFGEAEGKKIVGLLSLLAFLLVPVVFRNLGILISSIIFGSIVYYLINRKHYREKYIFLAYFLYVLSLWPFFNAQIIFN